MQRSGSIQNSRDRSHLDPVSKKSTEISHWGLALVPVVIVSKTGANVRRLIGAGTVTTSQCMASLESLFVPNDPKSDFRFHQKYRLKLRSDFNAVFEKGTVAADGILVTHAIRNDLGYTRIGLSISKRVGSAPIRNRWKRWMREAYRLNRQQLPIGLDVVIRPRRGAQGSFHAVEKAMMKLFRELDRKLPTTPH